MRRFMLIFGSTFGLIQLALHGGLFGACLAVPLAFWLGRVLGAFPEWGAN